MNRVWGALPRWRTPNCCERLRGRFSGDKDTFLPMTGIATRQHPPKFFRRQRASGSSPPTPCLDISIPAYPPVRRGPPTRAVGSRAQARVLISSSVPGTGESSLTPTRGLILQRHRTASYCHHGTWGLSNDFFPPSYKVIPDMALVDTGAKRRRSGASVVLPGPKRAEIPFSCNKLALASVCLL
jgi:hypothetical protein